MTNHQAQRTARRKLQAAARATGFANRRQAQADLPPVFFLTDSPDRTPRLLDVAAALPPGWGLIYRHFGAPDKLEIASRLARIAARRNLVLLIAADPGLARTVGAHGVHWPANRLPFRRARPRFSLETASAHNARELIRAARADVAAAICSPVFQSDSPSASRPIGLMRFASIGCNAPIRLYGLGGISDANAGRLTALPARQTAGLAAVSAIHNAWKPFGER